jgi:hypothetical protein
MISVVGGAVVRLARHGRQGIDGMWRAIGQAGDGQAYGMKMEMGDWM